MKNSIVTIFLFSILMVTGCDDEEPGLYMGNVKLENKKQLDDFVSKGHSGIAGNLLIGDLIREDVTITNLSGLRTIGTVLGDLKIEGTHSLKNLDGLDNVTEIGGYLSFENNTSLENIDALKNVATVDGDLEVLNNRVLLNLDGLRNLSKLNGGLEIMDNDQLRNIDGLNSLLRLNGGIYIYSNGQLEQIDGLSNLVRLGRGIESSIVIFDNDVLTNIKGLQSITSIEGNVGISTNPLLKTLDGLNDLKSLFLGSVGISNNEQLENIRALSNLTNVSVLRITGNTKLKNLDGLQNLVTVRGSIEIKENINLFDFCAIQAMLQNGGFIENEYSKYNVTLNAYNPSKQDLLVGNCRE